MFSNDHGTTYSLLGIISNKQQYQDLQSKRRVALIKALWVIEQSRGADFLKNKGASKRTPR